MKKIIYSVLAAAILTAIFMLATDSWPLGSRLLSGEVANETTMDLSFTADDGGQDLKCSEMPDDEFLVEIQFVNPTNSLTSSESSGNVPLGSSYASSLPVGEYYIGISVGADLNLITSEDETFDMTTIVTDCEYTFWGKIITTEEIPFKVENISVP